MFWILLKGWESLLFSYQNAGIQSDFPHGVPHIWCLLLFFRVFQSSPFGAVGNKIHCPASQVGMEKVLGLFGLKNFSMWCSDMFQQLFRRTEVKHVMQYPKAVAAVALQGHSVGHAYSCMWCLWDFLYTVTSLSCSKRKKKNSCLKKVYLPCKLSSPVVF